MLIFLQNIKKWANVSIFDTIISKLYEYSLIFVRFIGYIIILFERFGRSFLKIIILTVLPSNYPQARF